jgi:hypothetical protein
VNTEPEGPERAEHTLAMIGPLIADLSRLGLSIELDAAGRLIIDGHTDNIDSDVEHRIRVCADLLRWHVLGRETKTAWAPCDRCGLASMVARDVKERPCRMTPKCEGRHRVPVLTRARAARAAAQLLPPIATTNKRTKKTKKRTPTPARRSARVDQ